MKYTLYINQKQALELGIKNVNQVIILGLIADAHSWAEPEIVEKEVYYWTARKKIADELPILGLKSDSVYRHLKSLADLKLIDYIKIGKKDCVKLTKKGKSYYVGNKSESDDNSEMNPSKFGNKSEKHSEMNPTYKNTNLIRVTSDKYSKKLKKEIAVKLEDYPLVNLDAFFEWINRKSYKDISPVTKLLNFLSQYDFQTQQRIVDDSIMNNWAGLFPPKQQNTQQPQSFKQQDKQIRDDNIDFALENNIYDMIDQIEAQSNSTPQGAING